MRGVLRPLIGRSTWRRWAYLVAGGALLMPYWILAMPLVGLLVRDQFLSVVLIFVLPVPAAFITGLVPAVRLLEGTSVKELVGGPIAGQPIPPARTWQARFRTGCWFAMHLHGGVIVGFLSLAIPGLAGMLLVVPFVDWDGDAGVLRSLRESWYGWLMPGAGLLILAGLMASFAGTGALLARLAPAFLGPTPGEKLADLETRAVKLAERNRLARELHDSVGHALSVVTLQAAAAGRVLDDDPAFAREALGAIEESARGALEDLDHVLGLLREDRGHAGTAPQYTLSDLDRLLDKTRMAGVVLDAEVGQGLDRVPAAVSREAYRIVQEGLTNALRHAGKVPVSLRIMVSGDLLEVELSNPLGSDRADHHGAAPAGRGGGRGLRGIRERVTVLRGAMTAGPDGGRWRIGVSLPLRSAS